MNRVDYNGNFWFPVSPDELWNTIEQFDRFGTWWVWLRTFRAERDGLVIGNVLHGTVIPPLPYRLRLDIHLDTCERPHLIQATVGGDLSGSATIHLDPSNNGTEVSLSWTLEFVSAPLRLAARLAYPLMRWGHDRVVDLAVAGFRQHALKLTGPT